MLFNSIDFAILFPIFFLFYWIVSKKLFLQNILIVIASYFFYASWNVQFLFLIIASTLTDFILSQLIHRYRKKSLIFLCLSLSINLGILLYFKYSGFFISNFVEIFSFFGQNFEINELNLILPVGISFYTFQTLSYTIDVYRGKLQPTKDYVKFSAFVSFFPQLVAGPIERANSFLPQFNKERKFDLYEANQGMKMILWGLFKKIVIADNAAYYVNEIFGDFENMNSSALIVGAILFSFQIYGDFSGYSDIAIGLSKLLGFNLTRNFHFPYFSRDIAEFWRRWHISLTSWFKDYVYIPLGGSRGGLKVKVRNTFIVFIISGFWHGANWTFIFWGLLNAIFFLPLLVLNRNRSNLEFDRSTSFISIINITTTFLLTTIAWVFFRSYDIQSAIQYLMGILSYSVFDIPSVSNIKDLLKLTILLLLLLIIEWKGRYYNFALERLIFLKKKAFRILFYYIILFTILYFGGNEEEFIYFQF